MAAQHGGRGLAPPIDITDNNLLGNTNTTIFVSSENIIMNIIFNLNPPESLMMSSMIDYIEHQFLLTIFACLGNAEISTLRLWYFVLEGKKT